MYSRILRFASILIMKGLMKGDAKTQCTSENTKMVKYVFGNIMVCGLPQSSRVLTVHAAASTWVHPSLVYMHAGAGTAGPHRCNSATLSLDQCQYVLS
jgi:hypothetical protein